MSLVSVITPTWQRHDLLLNRCIPSVKAQMYPKVEHIVCSDGPDRALGRLLPEDILYIEVPHHDEHPMNFGSRARNHALRKASGEFVAYLDDDNAWRPDHLVLLVGALVLNPDADFAYGQMLTHPQGVLITSDPPRYGGIDTSMIVHRRELLDKGQWPKPSQITGDKHAPDWAIVESWLAKGARWVSVPSITVDYHFAGS